MKGNTCHDVMVEFRDGFTKKMLTGTETDSRGAPAEAAGSLPLIVRKPCTVVFGGRSYKLSKEGLYRFWDWGVVEPAGKYDVPAVVDGTREYTSIILYRKNLVSLLAALAAIHIHGYRHQGISFDEQVVRAKQGSLSLTCGPSARFFMQLLGTLGHTTRFVGGHKLSSPFNTYDNGHGLFEIYLPDQKRWMLADIDQHCIFPGPTGYLDLQEVSDLIASGEQVPIERLLPSGIGTVDTTEAVMTSYSSHQWMEGLYADDEAIRSWYRSCLEVPLVESEGKLYYPVKKRSWKEIFTRNYPKDYFPLPEAEWNRRFYNR
jgi:hypothetical protein